MRCGALPRCVTLLLFCCVWGCYVRQDEDSSDEDKLPPYMLGRQVLPGVLEEEIGHGPLECAIAAWLCLFADMRPQGLWRCSCAVAGAVAARHARACVLCARGACSGERRRRLRVQFRGSPDNAQADTRFWCGFLHIAGRSSACGPTVRSGSR